ncbi:MAG: protein-L-isoaspartate(D-aspartate) O-methyltransferase [Alphaproteobacteria bacterium]
MTTTPEDHFALLRHQMVDEIAAHTTLVSGEIDRPSLNPRVMAAMATVPRHDYVPVEMQPFAYVNCPLPIGCGKTISQPFIVALMIDLLEIESGDRVLEVGTGLGYQAAVLAALAERVYTVEIIEELAEAAVKRLACCRNVEVRIGDGRLGLPAEGPFDKIIVAAAPDLVPPALLSQLKPGGRMVIPCGIPEEQKIVLVTKDASGRLAMKDLLPVRFSALEEGGAP